LAEEPSHGYRIDYDDLDVDDLVAQIHDRVRRQERDGKLPPQALEEQIKGRLRTYVDLDDDRPYELQSSLHLEGPWNLSPDDLRSSGRRGLGSLIALSRSLFRPVMKLVSNVELPIYKQFKINLGMAEALHDSMRQTAELQGRVEELAERLEKLEQAAGDRRQPAAARVSDDRDAES
jgi:hypothetical protein